MGERKRGHRREKDLEDAQAEVSNILTQITLFTQQLCVAGHQ